MEWDPIPNIGIETEIGENADAGMGINWKWHYLRKSIFLAFENCSGVKHRNEFQSAKVIQEINMISKRIKAL